MKKRVYNKEKHIKNGVYCLYKGKSCLHYETQKQAEHALKFVESGNYENINYVPIRAYLCGCGSWHLTSKPLNCNNSAVQLHDSYSDVA
ncbi:MAG: hypothetical protein FWF00_01145 [Endomicrobia bacterium]|nr:hypothetical protein [Endomicrobiia bacterium]MCL2506280.1 hypothetical protein [Endomicrobiia bacterium]